MDEFTIIAIIFIILKTTWKGYSIWRDSVSDGYNVEYFKKTGSRIEEPSGWWEGIRGTLFAILGLTINSYKFWIITGIQLLILYLVLELLIY